MPSSISEILVLKTILRLLSRLFLEKLTSVFLISRFLFRKSSNNGKNVNYISEDDFEFPKLIPIRA